MEILEGEITLSGDSQCIFINCNDGLSYDGLFPSINFDGNGNTLAVRNYSGDLHLKNKSGPEAIEINMSTGGHITLENTVINGNIRITGIAEVTDESTGNAIVDVSNVIFPDQLQLASFNSYVYLKIGNGNSGVKFPNGTLQHPVDNIDDAIAILKYRGLDTILLDGTLVLTDTDISEIIFIGENVLNTIIILSSGNITTKTTFKNLIISGEINGFVFIESCGLQSLRNVGDTIYPTVFRECIIRGDNIIPTITLNSGATQNIHFIECVSGVPGNGTATIDYNGSSSPVGFRKYGGGITLKNITENQDSTFEFSQGQIILDSSCTSGKIRLGGIYKLTNNSSLLVEERNDSITSSIGGGTFTGDTELIASAVWDKLTSDHETANSFGKMLNDILVATGQAQHSLNVHTEMLKNKPNNP